jgi:hypothetical protein
MIIYNHQFAANSTAGLWTARCPWGIETATHEDHQAIAAFDQLQRTVAHKLYIRSHRLIGEVEDSYGPLDIAHARDLP